MIAVAGLVKTGMTNEEIAVECSLTLAAVRRAMAAVVEASPSSDRRAAA